MRFLRIDFVEGENRLTRISRKTFQLCFNNYSKGFTYGGCFCWQDYPKGALIKINNNKKIVKVYKTIKAPTIIVAKQSNFFKTLGILIHEFGHYIVWLLFYRKKKKKKPYKLAIKTGLYDLVDDLYDSIYHRIFPATNIYMFEDYK